MGVLKECVLLIDKKTGEVVLEKISNSITLKKSRDKPLQSSSQEVENSKPVKGMKDLIGDNFEPEVEKHIQPKSNKSNNEKSHIESINSMSSKIDKMLPELPSLANLADDLELSEDSSS